MWTIVSILFLSLSYSGAASSFAAEEVSSNSKIINEFSRPSLRIEILGKSRNLGSATGFVVEAEGKLYLVSNWHVITGCDPVNMRPIDQAGDIPNSILVWHHSNTLGVWHWRIEPLYDSEGRPRWIEHPLENKVDVVLLPLSVVDEGVKTYPFDLSLADTDMTVQVTSQVFIIGFPLGLSGPGVFPIWKEGIVASEPELDYRGEPVVLIDARTLGGMSGSPVIMHSTSYRTKTAMNQTAAPVTRFLGVYSERLHEKSDIGKVWRPRVIKEILQRGVRPQKDKGLCEGR